MFEIIGVVSGIVVDDFDRRVCCPLIWTRSAIGASTQWHMFSHGRCRLRRLRLRLPWGAQSANCSWSLPIAAWAVCPKPNSFGYRGAETPDVPVLVVSGTAEVVTRLTVERLENYDGSEVLDHVGSGSDRYPPPTVSGLFCTVEYEIIQQAY